MVKNSFFKIYVSISVYVQQLSSQVTISILCYSKDKLCSHKFEWKSYFILSKRGELEFP